MTTVGNIDYKKIENRQFVTVDTDKAADIISELTQKQVPFSGRYDDSRLTLHFSQKDWDIVQNALSGAARPHENDTSKAQQELDDLQQQLKRALERQKELEEQAAKVQQSQDKAEYTESSVFSGQPQPDQLLPILQAKAIQHTEKLDALSEKRTALENKIQTNHAPQFISKCESSRHQNYGRSCDSSQRTKDHKNSRKSNSETTNQNTRAI